MALLPRDPEAVLWLQAREAVLLRKVPEAEQWRKDPGVALLRKVRAGARRQEVQPVGLLLEAPGDRLSLVQPPSPAVAGPTPGM